MNAICKVCKKEMARNGGCTEGWVVYKIDGKLDIFNRTTHNHQITEGEPCHDCNAKAGEYHHWGCDMERCPRCGGQLISCDCPVEYLSTPEQEKVAETKRGL